MVLCEPHGPPSAEPVSRDADGEALYADETFEGFAHAAAACALRVAPLRSAAGEASSARSGRGAAAWPMRDFARAEAFLLEVTLDDEEMGGA